MKEIFLFGKRELDIIKGVWTDKILRGIFYIKYKATSTILELEDKPLTQPREFIVADLHNILQFRHSKADLVRGIYTKNPELDPEPEKLSFSCADFTGASWLKMIKVNIADKKVGPADDKWRVRLILERLPGTGSEYDTVSHFYCVS
jgi:hypothetical protein